MDPTRIAEEIDRRYFVGAAAMTFAGAQFGITDSANAQAIKPGAHTWFGGHARLREAP